MGTRAAGDVAMEPCLDAIAGGDGREIFQFGQEGQLLSVGAGSCVTLVDGDTTGGGAFALEACPTSAGATDGRYVFSPTPTGQVKMPRMGNFCLTLMGDSAVSTDVSSGAVVTATASDAQHSASSVVDGNDLTYWSSGFDPSAEVSMLVDLGAEKNIEQAVIEWEQAPLAFEIQVSRGGTFKTLMAVTSNNLNTTRFVGPSVRGSVLRVRMTQPHPLGKNNGHSVYAIKHIRVLASEAELVVQDCGEAEANTDARDKLFMVAVPEYDPSASALAKESALLLSASVAHLGHALAEIYSVAPTLAGCGFASSLLAAGATSAAKIATGREKESGPTDDDASRAISKVAAKLGLDMEGVETLIAGARDVLARTGK